MCPKWEYLRDEFVNFDYIFSREKTNRDYVIAKINMFWDICNSKNEMQKRN